MFRKLFTQLLQGSEVALLFHLTSLYTNKSIYMRWGRGRLVVAPALAEAISRGRHIAVPGCVSCGAGMLEQTHTHIVVVLFLVSCSFYSWLWSATAHR